MEPALQADDVVPSPANAYSRPQSENYNKKSCLLAYETAKRSIHGHGFLYARGQCESTGVLSIEKGRSLMLS